MDIELAIDALEIADKLDHMILFSGDGDFRRLVDAVQRRGKRVTVVSTMRSQPPMIADELRRQADQYIDLETMRDTIGRSHSDRPAPAVRNDDDYDYDDEDEDELDRPARA